MISWASNYFGMKKIVKMIGNLDEDYSSSRGSWKEVAKIFEKAARIRSGYRPNPDSFGLDIDPGGGGSGKFTLGSLLQESRLAPLREIVCDRPEKYHTLSAFCEAGGFTNLTCRELVNFSTVHWMQQHHALAQSPVVAHYNRMSTKSFFQEKLLAKRQQDLSDRARRWHSILSRILPYVQMGDEHVNRGITAVCTYGWQSLSWDRNHSLIHYAATTDSADLMYILILAQADPSKRDDNGRTIWDVAKRNNATSVLRTLDKLMQSGFIVGHEQHASKPVFEVKEELEVPQNLSPKLRQSIDMIRSQGTAAFKFNQGTGPMHLAAKDDRGDVIAYLWYMKCDLHQVDKQGRTPLDLATARKCNNACAVILSVVSGNPPRKPNTVRVSYGDPDTVPIASLVDGSTMLDPLGEQISMQAYMQEFGGVHGTRDDYVDHQLREYKQLLLAEKKRGDKLARDLKKAETKREDMLDMQRMANDIADPNQRMFASGLSHDQFQRCLNDLDNFGEDAVMNVLMGEPLAGGFGLSAEQAKTALSLMKIQQERNKGLGKFMVTDVIAVNYYDMAMEVDEEFMMTMLTNSRELGGLGLDSEQVDDVREIILDRKFVEKSRRNVISNPVVRELPGKLTSDRFQVLQLEFHDQSSGKTMMERIQKAKRKLAKYMISGRHDEMSEEDVNIVEYFYFRLRNRLGPRGMSPEEVHAVFMLIQQHGQDAVAAMASGQDVDIRVTPKAGSARFFEQLDLMARTHSNSSVASFLSPEQVHERQQRVNDLMKGARLLSEWMNNKLKTKQFEALQGFPELVQWLHSLSSDEIKKLVMITWDEGEDAREFFESDEAPSEIKHWLDGHTEKEQLAFRLVPQLYGFLQQVAPRDLSRLIGKQLHESEEVRAWLASLDPTYRRQIHQSREVNFMCGLLTPDQVAKMSKISAEDWSKIEPTPEMFALMLSMDDSQIEKFGAALADLPPGAGPKRIRDLIKNAGGDSPPSHGSLSDALSPHQHDLLDKSPQELMDAFKKNLNLSDGERALLRFAADLDGPG